MCGIFGVVTQGGLTAEERAQIIKLGKANTSRGRDAFGVFRVSIHNKVSTLKSPGSWVSHMNDDAVQAFLRKPAEFWVGHTRHATTGSPNRNINNHPITTNFHVGVHNGVIHDIPEDFAVTCEGEVDSEIIFRVLDAYGRSEMPDMLGWAAIVYTDLRDSTKLWVARSAATSLWYNRIEGATYFSSMRGPLVYKKSQPRQVKNGTFGYFDDSGNYHNTKTPFQMSSLDSWSNSWKDWEDDSWYQNWLKRNSSTLRNKPKGVVKKFPVKTITPKGFVKG